MRRETNTPEEPLDNEFEALRLLVDRSHRHGGYLCLNYKRRGGRGYKGPRIVVQHIGGYADMEVVGEEVTYVSERVVAELMTWTRGAAKWGYTDEHERHVTDNGESFYWTTGRQVGDGIDALLRLLHGAPNEGKQP